MSRLIQAAWLLPCLVLFGLLARDLIVEALNRRPLQGTSWGECCLDARDGLGCDCRWTATAADGATPHCPCAITEDVA